MNKRQLIRADLWDKGPCLFPITSNKSPLTLHLGDLGALAVKPSSLPITSRARAAMAEERRLAGVLVPSNRGGGW
jgi:hypothetical protein